MRTSANGCEVDLAELSTGKFEIRVRGSLYNDFRINRQIGVINEKTFACIVRIDVVQCDTCANTLFVFVVFQFFQTLTCDKSGVSL